MPNVNEALSYARRGWRIFPVHAIREGRCPCGNQACEHPGKHPHISSWQEKATTDETQIRDWWTRWPDANIGMPTGAINNRVVIDIDPRNDGDIGFDLLQEDAGPLPETWEVFTGGGGRHLHYAHPGVYVKSVSGKLAAGVDVKADGGYVLLPPSNHVSGGIYEWEATSGPDDLPLAAFPTALLRLLSEPQRPQPSQAENAPIPEGRRNETLAKMAGAMRRQGMTPTAILAALQVTNQERCQPPLSDEEVKRIADSVGRYAPQADPLPQEGRPLPIWPTLDPKALYGFAGEIVRLIAPNTEADPVAILVQCLLTFGNVIGPTPHCRVEADFHGMNEFAVLVGATSKGRKGTAASHIRRLFQRVDEDWIKERVQGGLSSGEGLIWAVHDPIMKDEPVREKGKPTGARQEVVLDVGIADKRLYILEAEFATVLKMLTRDGNTLSDIIRKAWDGDILRSMTKNSPATATGAHISIVGQTTKHELLRYLSETEAGNGFGNRFLWCCVKRSNILPEGGRVPEADLVEVARELNRVINQARLCGELTRDDEARARWREVYPALSEGKPGLLGAMTSRAEAHVLRLSAIYALLDAAPVVKAVHLEAALALWDYCEASARFVFGDALGDSLADEILEMLRKAPEGLTRTQMRDAFGRHKSAKQLDRALLMLLEYGLARFEKQDTEGRPAERWRALEGAT